VALFSVPLLLASAPVVAAEGATAQCASAYENAQLVRQRGKLLAAREQASICAREQCPEVARKDCARWAEELGREIPSVVVVVRDDADRDVYVQRLLVDGVARVEVSSGRAFELDPGAHVLRIERANAPPVERSVTVYQGERDRVLRITVTAPSGAAAAAVPPSSSAAVPSAASASDSARREPPSYVLPAIVTGVSVASLAASAYLGLTGRQELSDLRTSCAPTCSDAQVDPVRTRLTLSDAALGVGLVGAALAVYLFVRTASERNLAASAHVEIAPTRDGALATVGGRF
jgi:hypothetical protein